MNATPRQPHPIRPAKTGHRSGFTLVEILVVIVIIGILMGIAIPAVTIAINRGKTVAMKLETDSIKDAISQYEQKHGDYPPDFSSWPIIERHYRKIFPRIGTGELNRLRMLLDIDASNDRNTGIPSPWPAHDATRMDRGEVLVFVLGGYSDNPIQPFTGPGGPLEEIDQADTMTVTFQYNNDRPNKLFDFDPSKLDLTSPNAASALDATNRYQSSDGDLFPSYEAAEGTPYIYFDSRTYAIFDSTVGDFNGYSRFAGSVQPPNVLRPYLSQNANPNTSGAAYSSSASAIAAWDFVNPDTFQVLAPGLDGVYGEIATVEVSGNNVPLYFQYPGGTAIAAVGDGSASAPGDLIVSDVNSYQERNPNLEQMARRPNGADLTTTIAENYHQDNIGDFSNGKLVDDVP